VDLHALRHTYSSRRSGAAPAGAKSRARHSTIVLTMDPYTHTLIGDERAALDRLPSIDATRAGVAAPAATGT
jgi:integrase